jgi:putative transcription factor
MQCDMCGRTANLSRAIVEGSMLSVCDNCVKFGNVIEVEKRAEKYKTDAQTPVKLVSEETEIIVTDFNTRIKKAREAKNLTQEKLAVAIAEKESVIHKLESRQMMPSIKLARKLEQFLHITIVARLKEGNGGEHRKDVNLKDRELTIGDLIEMQK